MQKRGVLPTSGEGMKRLALYGSTGSIGKQTLEIVEKFPHEFEIVVLAVLQNIDLLEEQISRFHPKRVVVFDEQKGNELQKRVNIPILSGKQGLIDAFDCSFDLLVQAMSGTLGIESTLEAAKRGIPIAIANKESLIAASTLLAPYNPILLPMDSEHNSLFELMDTKEKVVSMTITASGGPFINHTKEQLKKIRLEEALKHPNYSMGASNTINSSTLFNKALEVMEAYYLFNVVPKAVIERTQMIHGMVTFEGGMTKLLAYPPNMRYPILHILSYPKKLIYPFINQYQIEKIQFEPIDEEQFPTFRLAAKAIALNGSYPAFAMFLNEALINSFMKGRIGWFAMQEKLIELFETKTPYPIRSIEDIEELKTFATQLVNI